MIRTRSLLLLACATLTACNGGSDNGSSSNDAPLFDTQANLSCSDTPDDLPGCWVSPCSGITDANNDTYWYQTQVAFRTSGTVDFLTQGFNNSNCTGGAFPVHDQDSVKLTYSLSNDTEITPSGETSKRMTVNYSNSKSGETRTGIGPFHLTYTSTRDQENVLNTLCLNSRVRVDANQIVVYEGDTDYIDFDNCLNHK